MSYSNDPKAPQRPIFYDESRRRWSWVLRLGAVALVAAAVAVACFAASVLALPLLPHNALPRVREARDAGNPADPKITDRQRARKRFVIKKQERELETLRAADRAARKARLAASRAERHQPSLLNGPTVVAGFYVNWEETSKASLRRHVDDLTHFFPEWLDLGHDGRTIVDLRIPEDRKEITPFVKAHGLPILPVIHNYSDARKWDSDAVHNLITNPVNRAAFIAKLKAMVVAEGWQGINVDFEEFPVEDREAMVEFMRELYGAFHPAGLAVTQDIQMEVDWFDIPRLALWNDAIIPMLYDQHSPGDEAGPGPVAAIDWTRARMAEIFKTVPASKVILGFGNYAYDWQKGDLDAATLSYQAAVVQAKESADPKDSSVARIQIDPKSLNPTYRYFDDDDQPHTVWMMDATTAYNQWQVAQEWRPRGFAMWYLGAEDPGVWKVLGRTHIADRPGQLIAKGAIGDISYGRQSQVDFEGEGELLDVVAQPNEGHRTLKQDPKTGLVTAENYSEYPSSYVVRRYGHKAKSIALTFDDGPDPTWTPKILDVLKREGVKATFFEVGKQAEENPAITARVWSEGHEIGNHTFSHPNLAEMGQKRTLLEINTTQRILEAITGHTTTLFRPPYAIDVEPRTGGELKPILLASKWNFVSVGEKIDPQDWNLTTVAPSGHRYPSVAARVEAEAWADRDDGNVLLLHDGGGDRSGTVEALPRIIERYKAAGYKFITISDLRGMTRAQMFPPVRGDEEALVGVDRLVFEVSYAVQRTLVTLFTLSVVLGVSRQVWVALLACIQWVRERRRDAKYGNVGVWEYGSMGAVHSHTPTLPHSHTPAVSVIIAAYNEAKVISRTVKTVLDSRYPALEVIVVDDGSKDDTLGVVQAEFAGDARVACIRKENGGKASALNVGLAQATGEVIVALDADTLFAPDTIQRLVRHFADPTVGAVSGNVRVGNENNVLTRWQSLEYVTSQNFDRRAYDLMNCITVVPGAVGAWRRSAIEAVGGYTSDTLAEDTDLTWKVRRAGWRILNDSTALAYTEAPESLRNLSRQRFRWAFGTLQNLCKHREAVGRHGAFGWVALPSLWLYQILFPAISPIMDVTVVWALVAGNAGHVLAYYGLMVGVEFLGAALAVWMDRGSWKLLPWLFVQRLVYRQVMYYVILKSVVAAVRGGAVGWNKFERRGTAQLAAEAEAIG